jgi:hypothetical protein
MISVGDLVEFTKNSEPKCKGRVIEVDPNGNHFWVVEEDGVIIPWSHKYTSKIDTTEVIK